MHSCGRKNAAKKPEPYYGTGLEFSTRNALFNAQSSDPYFFLLAFAAATVRAKRDFRRAAVFL